MNLKNQGRDNRTEEEEEEKDIYFMSLDIEHLVSFTNSNSFVQKTRTSIRMIYRRDTFHRFLDVYVVIHLFFTIYK